MVEDTHTCYMADYAAGYRMPVPFIEKAKKNHRSNACVQPEDHAVFAPNELAVTVNAVHFYHNVVVIEKRKGQRSGATAAD